MDTMRILDPITIVALLQQSRRQNTQQNPQSTNTPIPASTYQQPEHQKRDQLAPAENPLFANHFQTLLQASTDPTHTDSTRKNPPNIDPARADPICADPARAAPEHADPAPADPAAPTDPAAPVDPVAPTNPVCTDSIRADPTS
ncbi:hypothetical protein RUND412_006240 [Rhizina undulata]